MQYSQKRAILRREDITYVSCTQECNPPHYRHVQAQKQSQGSSPIPGVSITPSLDKTNTV